jgi:hypothetical protein
MYIYADFSCILIGVDSRENLRITEKGAGAEIMNLLSEQSLESLRAFKEAIKSLYLFSLRPGSLKI